jgi:hypothetical protein
MPKIFMRKPENQERMKEILVSWRPYSMGCGSVALQCYLPTSSRAAKIFQERGQPCPRVSRHAQASCGQDCPRSFGCGSAALRLGVEFPLDRFG